MPTSRKTSKAADPLPLHAERLIDWFIANRRPLPWRESLSATSARTTIVKRIGERIDQGVAEANPAAYSGFHPSSFSDGRDPYRTWISEIMLQQTQVATVVDYFDRWIRLFPDLPSLAAAKEEDVLKAWAGLGYYSRGRNLLATARILAAERGGRFPGTRAELLALPGIGEYTAGAILSLAFNLPEAILDGNLIRVFSRFHRLAFLPDTRETREAYWSHARSWVSSGEPALVNEGLMELGALVCQPRNPRCGACPLAPGCGANAQDIQDSLPPPKLRRETRKWRGYALIILWDNQVLLRRPAKPEWLAGLPAFPLLEAATPEELDKACRESHPGWGNYTLRPTGLTVVHGIMHNRLTVELCRVDFGSGKEKPSIGEGYFWVEKEELPGFSVSSLTRKIEKRVW